jgi:hypothetical protein
MRVGRTGSNGSSVPVGTLGGLSTWTALPSPSVEGLHCGGSICNNIHFNIDVNKSDGRLAFCHPE